MAKIRGSSRCPDCRTFARPGHKAEDCIVELNAEVRKLETELEDAREQFQLERARKLLPTVAPLPSPKAIFANALVAAVRKRAPSATLPRSLPSLLEVALGDLGF